MDNENKSIIKHNTPAQSSIRSLVSGAGAGVICTFICAPLDVAKVRLQVQGSLNIHKYNGNVMQTIHMIFKEEGIRGIFKGVGPALITVPLFWGVYFSVYNKMKIYFIEEYNFSTHLGHLYSAIIAGAVGDIITNPFWVTRTRIQTLAMHSDCRLSPNISTFQMMRYIYKNEGFSSFYRGLGASFLGLSHVAIQFPLYEYLKAYFRNRSNEPESFLEILTSSTIAKLIASSITYPHEVLRARLQDSSFSYSSNNLKNIGNPLNRSKPGLFSLIKYIIETEGFMSLWSGLRVSLTRIVPATASTFVAYEYINRYLYQNNIL